jgi:inner membrane protein
MIVFTAVGAGLLLGGVILLALELVHPGALLFIPASILLVGGLLYILLPSVLLDSPIGVILVLVAAIIAALVEIPFYHWVAPNHPPMTTTAAGLAGEEAVVTVAIVPDTLKGKVRVRTEIWSAHAPQPIPEGTRVRIVRGGGVSVEVEPISK